LIAQVSLHSSSLGVAIVQSGSDGGGEIEALRQLLDRVAIEGGQGSRNVLT
jgi:hypothetical protein